MPRRKFAQKYSVGTLYVSKLMKPEAIATLEQNRDKDLNQDALLTPKPVHEGLESHLQGWINIVRA